MVALHIYSLKSFWWWADGVVAKMMRSLSGVVAWLKLNQPNNTYTFCFGYFQGGTEPGDIYYLNKTNYSLSFPAYMWKTQISSLLVKNFTFDTIKL